MGIRWVALGLGCAALTAIVVWFLLRPPYAGHWILDAYQIDRQEVGVDAADLDLDHVPFVDFGLRLRWSDGCVTVTFQDASVDDGILRVSPAEFINRRPCPGGDDWGGTRAMNETWKQAFESGVAVETDGRSLSIAGEGVALYFIRP